MSAIRTYHAAVGRILDEIVEAQGDAIEKASRWVAETIQAGGIVYTLGSGHSIMIAAELYYRAGGLAPFDVIHDKTFGRAERLVGYAKILLDCYPISSKDLLILVSNSGRNPLPVEMAIEARARNIRTIALTSFKHSRSVQPRAGLEHRLMEIADLAIDNCGEVGDATIPVHSLPEVRVAPTSTLAGVFIVNCIVAEATQLLAHQGIQPPVFVSSNVDHGDQWNASLMDFMKERIRGL